MDNMVQSKRRLFTSMIALLLLIITIVGITYAYFISRVQGNSNDESVNITSGKLELTYGDGNGEIVVEKIQPGVVLQSKTFTVKNTGTGYINDYEVVLENVINELEYYEDMTYELICESDKTGGTCNGNSGIFPKTDSVIVVNGIDSGETQSYTLTLTFKETGFDQSNDMNKLIRAKVNITDEE